jgi:hypothetical protein
MLAVVLSILDSSTFGTRVDVARERIAGIAGRGCGADAARAPSPLSTVSVDNRPKPDSGACCRSLRDSGLGCLAQKISTRGHTPFMITLIIMTEIFSPKMGVSHPSSASPSGAAAPAISARPKESPPSKGFVSWHAASGWLVPPIPSGAPLSLRRPDHAPSPCAALQGWLATARRTKQNPRHQPGCHGGKLLVRVPSSGPVHAARPLEHQEPAGRMAQFQSAHGQ